MLKKLRQYLSPPEFDDEALAWQARILNVVLLIALPLTIAFLILLLAFSSLPLQERVFPLLIIALIIALFVLLRHGYVRSTSILLISLTSVILLGKTLLSGQIDYIGYTAFVIPIILGGLLLGRRAVIFLTLTGIGVGLVVLIINGTAAHVRPDPNDPIMTWSLNSFIFLWTAGLLLLAVEWLDHSIKNARFELEENLKTLAENARLAAVVEQATESVIISDPDGKIVYVNPSFELMSGVTAAMLAGNGNFNLSDLDQSVHTLQNGSRENGNQDDAIQVFNSPDGNEIYAQTTHFPIINQAGQIINYVTIGRDVTELYKTEQERNRNLDELRILHQVAVACTEICEEDGLIEKVTSIIGENLFTNNVGVLLLDTQGEYLYTHPSFRASPELKEERIPLEEGIIGRAVSTGSPIRAGDVNLNPYYRDAIPGIRSELCVPIKVSDQTIGAIDVESENLDAFSEQEERLLVTTASLLGTALSRLRHDLDLEIAEASLRTYTERLEAMREVDEAILKAQSPEEIAQETLEHIRRLVGCERASVALFDMENFQIQILAKAYATESDISTGDRLPISAFSSIPYLFEKKPYIIDDLSKMTVRSSSDESLIAAGYRSTLVAPLIAHEELIGSLNLASSQPAYFQGNQIEITRELAASLAIALQNARLLKESQDRAYELASLYQTTVALNSELETSGLLQKLFEQVQRLIRPDTFVVALYLPVTSEMQLAMVIEKGVHLIDWEGKRISLEESSLIGWVMRTQQSLLVGDLQSDPIPVQSAPSDRPARAWLGVPLVASGRLVGAVSVQSFQPRAFDRSHKRFLESLSVQIAAALENATLFEQTERRLEHVQALHRIDTAISTSLDLPTVLKVVLEQVINQLHVDAATILLLNPHTQTLDLSARVGFHTGALRHTHLQVGESFAGRAALERHIIHVANLQEQPGDLSRAVLLAQEGFVTYYATPLETKGQVKGVLEIYHRSSMKAQTEWLEFLETLATQAAIAIENATLFQELQRTNQELTLAYDTTLEGWSHALELRDRETQGHSSRVVRLTLQLAQLLGIQDDQLAHVRRGALLHDIGKMGIPDSILLKTGSLSDDEWGIMRQHPVYAYRLLSQIPFLRPALDIPYCHHERWDGTGYPQGLKEEQIPLSARIFTVVDVWDALLSERPYRPAWKEDDALEYIRTETGKHFDPQVVEIFLKVVQDEKYIIEK